MSNKLITQLLRLLDYNQCETIVFVDGEAGFYNFKTLQNFITLVQNDDVVIPDIDTYYLSNATIQKSLFDEKDIVYLFLK